MFIRQTTVPLRFFRTTPALRCPYLPNRFETKLVTELGGPDALDIHDQLTDAGFRRSHHYVYKPLCGTCSACVPVRIPVDTFTPSRSQRRTWRSNQAVSGAVVPPMATSEQFALFSRYVAARHGDGDMAEMDFDDYRAMIEESPVDTHLVELREDGRLVAACLTDWLGNGISAVYSFFDTRLRRRALGVQIVMWLVEEARRRGLPYVYLGYWISGATKMDYKARYRPLEALGTAGWEPFDPDGYDDDTL
ncbi:arginyltransferase [Reyranella sp. CPCC 100927]|uniref:arginyltransferase n=1 Tax=Reyranella sp. CPCC 100927 TaxID=2599616 RepID=UPI0011B7984A|nr:arginyltransferase [Reyranella sp. CPCC 100927]TWT05777.1 arginyltransferase [Reyranella sp. CPCC 100927]